MKVSKWVETEIEVDIGADDIRAALGEAFDIQPRSVDDGPSVGDVTRALSYMGQFLNALTDQQIGKLPPAVRSTVAAFLEKAAKGFRDPAPSQADPARSQEGSVGNV